MTWIRTADDLAAFVSSLTGCAALALDTESDSLYHHVEKVCLVQVAPAGGPGRLIDPLAVPSLAPLGPILADPAVTKVLHGSDYDVTTLKRDFGFTFASLFDTMIAARFLGRTQFGLQDLLRVELGVEVTKKGQKDDWSRRPLTPAQETYALADVAHLLRLHERLVEQLTAAGRLAWVQEECDTVAALPPSRRRSDPNAYQKLNGAERLAPRALAILKELYGWRERRAETTNIPPFKIVDNSVLVALATAPPATPADLGKVPRVRQLRGDSAATLLEAIAHGQAVPEADLPHRQWTRPPMVPERVRKQVAALKVLRDAEAARMALEPSLILSQKLIDRIVEAMPRTREDLAKIEGIRCWRAEAFGAVILAALV